jgi:hypothetical protein
MSVVGIITNSSNIIELENKLNIIVINEKSIENMKNVKFDIVIIYQETKQNENIKQLISTCKYLVINTDIKENLKLLEGIDISETTIITYGFNRKSSITIVSNENDEIILEIQREINNLKNEKIECQEIKLQNNLEKNQIYLAISLKILEILEEI